LLGIGSPLWRCRHDGRGLSDVGDDSHSSLVPTISSRWSDEKIFLMVTWTVRSLILHVEIMLSPRNQLFQSTFRLLIVGVEELHLLGSPSSIAKARQV
jgi:hypothetical protein